MANIIDYMKWRGDITLKQCSINNVDNLIFSKLSYIAFDTAAKFSDNKQFTLAQGADYYLQALEKGEIIPLQEQDGEFMQWIKKSKRYKNLIVSNYVNIVDYQHELQFSAITIHLNKNDIFISYRGTDNTIVGWKEDFNMGFMDVVPAQVKALEYLEAAYKDTKGYIYLGGHSKGGNLAVYAAANTNEKIQSRIKKIYNNDGPGFKDEMLLSKGYNAIINKINKFIPQSSVVGLLFEQNEKCTIIHSNTSGILQHDIYTWEVMADNFLFETTTTNSSKIIDKTLKEFVLKMTNEQREKLFDALYAAVNATNAKTLTELGESKIASTAAVIKSLGESDSDTKKLILTTFSILFSSLKDSIPTTFSSSATEEKHITILDSAKNNT